MSGPDTFVLTVRLSGAAFEKDRERELRRILDDVARRVGDFVPEGTVRDIFGTRCGAWGILPEVGRDV